MNRHLKTALSAAALATVYFLAARLALMVTYSGSPIAAFWPSTGIALGAMLLYGRRLFVGVLVGDLVLEFSTTGHPWVALAIALGNSFGALLVTVLVERYAGGTAAFDTVRGVARYTLFGSLLGTLLSAAIGPLAFVLGYGSWEGYGQTLFTWWISDVVSVLLVAPLIVLWARPGLSSEPFRLPHGIALATLLAAVSTVVFADLAPRTLHVEFLLIPLVVWVGLRFHMRVVALSSLGISTVAIFATLQGMGPLTHTGTDADITNLQGFMGLLGITALMVAAMAHQRRAAESALRRSHADLEERVTERTASLATQSRRQAALAELGQMALQTHDLGSVMRQAAQLVGRELCMDRAAVHELEPDEANLRVRWAVGWPADYLGTSVPATPDSEAGFAFGSPEAVVVEDIARDGRFRPGPAALREGITCGLSVAILGAGRPYGVLSAHATRPRPILPADADFLQSVASILGSTAERFQSDERFQQLADNSSAIFALLSADARDVQFVNSAFSRITGHPAEALLRDPGLWTHLMAPEDRARVDADLQAMVEKRTPCVYEARFHCADGRLRWLRSTTCPVQDADGRVVRWVVVAEDVTGQHEAGEALRQHKEQLEQAVVERTAELRDAIRELEAVGYAISHDLRSPLRTIDGFSSQLLTRNAEHLDERGRAWLERIRAAAQRMGELLDDANLLLRVAQAPLRPETVDVSAVVAQVAADLQACSRGRRARVEVQPGLRARGDPRLVREAIEALLDNAWKFTANREDARIEVGAAAPQGDELVFFVRDNGVGFDPAHAARLFQPFQRLHPVGAFAGRGIGLATVHRVVQRHGGRAWAVGAPDAGATFYFTLPRARPAEAAAAAQAVTA